MSTRYSWSELPDAVRAAVQAHTGPIGRTVAAGAGQSCDAALTLCRDGMAPVFCKAVKGISREMRWLRTEVESAGLVGGLAPAVLFSADLVADGEDWFVVGFEHVAGRPANLAPGSPDLPVLASLLDRIGAVSAPHLRSLGDRWGAPWWDRLARDRPGIVSGWDLAEVSAWEQKAPGLVRGDRLVHTDLHADQFVIGAGADAGGAVRVLDWAWPASGAAWVDPAFLVIRLIGAGHTPAQAEAWARAHTHFADAPQEAVTAFAVYVAGLWTAKAATTDALARLAREYARWRLRERA
ncbi:hypothetical protein DMA12_00680 [Amycolatopsis balhimycina DSM 5908]|uniref:Aminoglycoside phosphotransferase domain-containing protein n=1 Tax=Amycolatopsis balhimycina DSM 5908 TaxID=1081091 RepID=A0A428X6G9_AMYBA|nr:hypothetical protein DMA12_00680 [Amycolatopsis balhimycina DSM 5908]